MNLLTQIYIGNNLRLDTRRANNFELFNDMCVYIITVHFYMFSDYISEESTKYNLGWSCIGWVGFNIVINMTPILFNILKMIKLVVTKNFRLLKRKIQNFTEERHQNKLKA